MAERDGGPALKIRYRERRGYVREAERHMEWSEWQVVEGRKIIARFDFKDDAKQFVANRIAARQTKD